MCRVGVHARMPPRRYHEPRRWDREFETFKTRRGVVVTPEAIAKARTRHERDQIRLARDPHRIRISRHDNEYCPDESELLQGIVD